MAEFCHFWRISPAEFWQLDMEEYNAMARHMSKVQEARRDAANKNHPRRQRR